VGGGRNGRWKPSGCDRKDGGNRETDDGLACSSCSPEGGEAGGEGKTYASRTLAWSSRRVLGGQGKRDGGMWSERKAGSVAGSSMARTCPMTDCVSVLEEIFAALSSPSACVRDMAKGGGGTPPNQGERGKGACRRVLGVCVVGLGCAPVLLRGSNNRV
jgi:hypothetical protein